MPLLKGKKNIGKNIATEISHGKPPEQAKAIALSVANVPKKKKSIIRRRVTNQKCIKLFYTIK